MYKELIDQIISCGDLLPAKAGKIIDIGTKKQWLTEQDIEIERKLASIISKFEGNYTIFSEEEHNSFEVAENIWIIDPISHTFNYIHGLPHYAVVLSHILNDEVVFCVVYDPSTKELFKAHKGEGAYLNEEKIQINSSDKDLSILYDPFPLPMYKREDNLELYSRLIEKGRVKYFGSLALHYAYVACGRANIAVTRNKDTFPEFAGKLLVEEAGGVFSDFNGKDLKINTKGILATSNSSLHNEILNITKNFQIQ